MSKTFHATRSIDGRTLEVLDHGEGLNIAVHTPTRSVGLIIATDDAPALALAILEAAGVKNAGADDSGGHWDDEHGHEFAVMWLTKYIDHMDAKAEAGRIAALLARRKAEKEAADLAKLEAEAVSLYLAFYPNSTVTRIGEIDSIRRAGWINTARHARELHAKP